jgi:hypothetical protein
MRTITFLIAAVGVIAVAAPLAMADSSDSTVTTTTRGWTGPGAPANPVPYTDTNANAVFVGGTPIIRIRVASGGMTPEERASAIQDRVNEILGEGPIMVSDVTVGPVGNEDAVYVKGKLILTADMETAKFNHSTPLALANTWADNLRGVLPGLTEAK